MIYPAGIFNGVPDLGFGLNDVADGKDLVGPALLVPFAKQAATAPVDLGFGIAGSTGNERGTTASTARDFRSPGQATIFRYRRGNHPATGDRRRRPAHPTRPRRYLYRGPSGCWASTPSPASRRRDTPWPWPDPIVEHKAWQVAGVVLPDRRERVLLRKRHPEEAVRPRRGWGAFELPAGTPIDFDDAAFPFFADPAASVTGPRPGASASTGTSPEV